MLVTEQITLADGTVTTRQIEVAGVLTEADGIVKTQADQQLAQTVATNEGSLNSKLDAALAANEADIVTGTQWLATNTGTLTTAVLSNAMRFTVRVLIALLRQQNASIRLARRKLDSVSGT